MEVQEIGSRGLLFTFPDFNPFPQISFSIQNYTIIGKNHIFICDTGLGTDRMNSLKQYLKNQNLDTIPMIVFNTHFHFDHVQGNKAFKSNQIISHILCRKRMIQSYKEKFISFPTLVFQQKLIFPEDKIEFFYSPGHSEDSISCYDHADKVMLVGDNLVDPIPLITWHRIDKYLDTLQLYCNSDAKTFVLGHNLVLKDVSFIKDTMKYLQKFKDFNVDTTNFTPSHATLFRWSLINIAMNLKEKGMIEEANRYLRYAEKTIQESPIKPLDENELNNIKTILKKELNNSKT